jgi:hypothetical protein
MYSGYLLSQFTVPSGQTIQATTNGGGPTVVNITAGTYASLEDFRGQLAADLNAQRPVTAGAWTVTLSLGASGTGQITIAVSSGTFSITWTSTNLRDLLGFTTSPAAVASATGARHAKGVWIPDSPIFTVAHYLSAPTDTDWRGVATPTGRLFGNVGNTRYRHPGAKWQSCPARKVWRNSESTIGESLEQFLLDSQWAQGHTWFSSSRKVIVIAHDDNELGNGIVAGWYLNIGGKMTEIAKRRDDTWDGYWSVTFPELTTDS